jgi:hypothetical protein
MEKPAMKLIKTIDDARLGLFAERLRDWLLADEGKTAVFSESRAKALLRATDAVDDATLNDFTRLVEGPTAVRLALHDLLQNSHLADNDDVALLAQSAIRNPQSAIPWLSLALAAFAWKSQYPLAQLDPAEPPEPYSPAGQVVQRAAHFLRQQVQRSATERDKLARKLAFASGEGDTPSLDALAPAAEIPPLPPYFRPPIPVNYPEVARETVRIAGDEGGGETAVSRSAPLSITEDDLNPDPLPNVTRMPTIRITEEQVRGRPAGGRVVTPPPDSGANFSDNVRRTFGRKEPMASTRLRVVVQEYPDGPGLYGLQVRVSCQGIKSFVAGTTNRDGKFLCELPVRVHSGLTYDVDITWPREMANEVERKSITLNADRTEFVLPFYRALTQ